MSQIAELNDTILKEEEGGNYLYKKDEYTEEENGDGTADGNTEAADKPEAKNEEKPETVSKDGYALPDFLNGEDDLIEIK